MTCSLISIDGARAVFLNPLSSLLFSQPLLDGLTGCSCRNTRLSHLIEPAQALDEAGKGRFAIPMLRSGISRRYSDTRGQVQ